MVKQFIILLRILTNTSTGFVCGITIGGAVGFTKEQFEDLNGFSNEYSVSDDSLHLE